MKTAEEWYVLETGRADMEWCVEQNKTDYIDRTRQIQLDAMKEGMRRSASIACKIADDNTQHRISITIDKSILTAAEQLTEKDL